LETGAVTSDVQVVMMNDGTIFGWYQSFLSGVVLTTFIPAASDSRKNGIAAGY